MIFNIFNSKMIPRYIYVSIMVKIPVDTRRHRQDGVSFNARLFIFRSDDEDILSVSRKTFIDDEL